MDLTQILDLQSISFASLFIWLLFDTNKKNQNREEKYQETISDLSKALNTFEDIKEMLKEGNNV